MGLLVIDRRGSRIALDGGSITVREAEERPRRVPVTAVDHLVVIGNITIDGSVCTRLAELGAAITFLPGRGSRPAAVLTAPGHGDAARRLGQYRLTRTEASRLPFARRFVRARVVATRRLLRSALRDRPDQRRTLVQADGRLASILSDLPEAGTLASLRGLEGAAARAFFEGYQSLFPAPVRFHSRNRRPPRDPVNAALSLGYTLLHADAVRALHEHGLDPQLGFLHDPAWSRESLACDLVELGRGRVERMVWRLFAERTLEAESFSRDGDGCRLGKTRRAAFFTAYARMAPLHRRWLRRTARMLARTCVAEPSAAGVGSHD